MNQRVSRGVAVTVSIGLIIAIGVAVGVGPAAAHETNTVEGYDIFFGGADEPIITGERQWFEIEITDTESGDPIDGAEDGLTLTVQQAGSEDTYEPDVSAQFGETGWYEAPIWFTETGDYAVTITGELDGTAIETTFEKPVEDHTDLQYPEADDGPAESSGLGAGFGPLVALLAAGLLATGLLIRRH